MSLGDTSGDDAWPALSNTTPMLLSVLALPEPCADPPKVTTFSLSPVGPLLSISPGRGVARLPSVMAAPKWGLRRSSWLLAPLAERALFLGSSRQRGVTTSGGSSRVCEIRSGGAPSVAAAGAEEALAAVPVDAGALLPRYRTRCGGNGPCATCKGTPTMAAADACELTAEPPPFLMLSELSSIEGGGDASKAGLAISPPNFGTSRLPCKACGKAGGAAGGAEGLWEGGGVTTGTARCTVIWKTLFSPRKCCKRSSVSPFTLMILSPGIT
mmetsp:Transcript_8527/g.23692  ORF Transcript_8527/g.23692 Transcript_8527/m.23692 type:complete len:270 (+) Transcript_8527:1482-2291(+)